MEKIIITATAESIEQVKELLEAGVDRIYVGEENFGLRLPHNFTYDELREIAGLVHEAGKEIVIACNALMHQDMMVAVRPYLDFLKEIKVDYYLDVLDNSITENGKELTNHIRANLNKCTDIIVVMSNITKFSQWVPFEVGMAAQKDMPTATFLKEDVSLPDYLQYWPRLKKSTDIREYVSARNDVEREYRAIYEFASQQRKTEHFYDVLKQRLK